MEFWEENEREGGNVIVLFVNLKLDRFDNLKIKDYFCLLDIIVYI